MSTLDRRTFVTTSARAGVALCGLCACGRLTGLVHAGEAGDDPIDPAVRCYCGYLCPEDCKFRQGTLNDDVALKREAWKLWKIEP